MNIKKNDTSTAVFESDLKLLSFMVSVNAKLGWQNTGIEVGVGEILRIEWYTGSWQGDVGMSSGCPKHGPAGPVCDAYTAPAGYPLPGVVEDCLVGKLVDETFYVGEQLRKLSKVKGSLHLTINDTGHHDNDGILVMKVSVGHK